jgi:DNA polymerase III subunit epsilon
MKPICFFDLETTGTDKMNDRIIEIAMVEWDGQVKSKFHSFVNPGIPIPAAATAVHGFTDAMVASAPTFETIASVVYDFIVHCDLGGFNSNIFDIPLLYVELSRVGYKLDLTGVNFIDSCTIFKRKEERTLSAAALFYTGDSHDYAHSAMDDVLATINVYKAQMERYPDLVDKSPADLSLYCNYDKPRCDLAGNFQADVDGDYIFSFGKHKGLKAKNHHDYLMWMMRQDFLPDTKQIISSLLK